VGLAPAAHVAIQSWFERWLAGGYVRITCAALSFFGTKTRLISTSPRRICPEMVRPLNRWEKEPLLVPVAMGHEVGP